MKNPAAYWRLEPKPARGRLVYCLHTIAVKDSQKIEEKLAKRSSSTNVASTLATLTPTSSLSSSSSNNTSAPPFHNALLVKLVKKVNVLLKQVYLEGTVKEFLKTLKLTFISQQCVRNVLEGTRRYETDHKILQVGKEFPKI